MNALPTFLKYFGCLLLFTDILSCKTKIPVQNPLELALASDDPDIRRVMDSVGPYEVQIRYTRIDRLADSIAFSDFDFQVNDQNYFYPASTVKFPIAVLALEKLNKTDTLSLETRYYIEGDSVENSFAEDISKIFSVSDNHANNRLLEFLGQDAINKGLHNKDIAKVRISHRLGIQSDDVTTKPLVVYHNDSTTSVTRPTINAVPKPLQLNGILKGKGYYEKDSLFLEPFDFSLKNYYPVSSQHEVMKRVIFPERFTKEERFDLDEAQREFLLKAMHTLPRELGFDTDEYYDGYCKFFIYGDTKARIPDDIKIYNKVGFAYGTLTDCAYIRDSTHDVEFLLTATILVNSDGIFNDDMYEYEEVGLPFLAALGRVLFAYESGRNK